MDNAFVTIYLLSVFAVGILAGRGIKNLHYYSVVNRSYGPLIIFATLSASFIGGGFSIGNAGKVFTFGIVNIIALWGFSLKEVLVATVIVPRMGNFPDAISVGDIMETNYGKPGKVISGIFSVMLCAGIVGAQVGGIGYVFNVFLGLPTTTGIIIGCGIVIIYATIGGMKAVIITDIIQFIVLAIGMPLVLLFGIHYVGGLTALTEAIPAGHFSLISEKVPFWAFCSLFLTFLLGETLVPPYVQRLLIGKSIKATARGTLFSGLFSIPVFAITGCIGLIALAIDPNLDSSLAMPFVIKTVLPIGLKGIVIAGVISIVMSSADSFLNSSSVAFIHDIITPFRSQRLPEKTELFIARLVTLIVGLCSVIFAIKIKGVLDILIYAYNFWAPIILVPLAATLLGRKASLRNLIAGAIAGIFGVIIWNQLLGQPGKVDGLVIGVGCNLVGFCACGFRAKGDCLRGGMGERGARDK